MVRVALRLPLLLAASLLCLSACGGGGGGGNSPTPPSPNRPSLVLTSNSLSFSARVPGDGVPTQAISAVVTRTNELTGTLYVLVTSTGPAVQNISGVAISGATGTAVVTPASSDSLGSGTHSSTITVRACMNSANCASGELAGSPATINVTYTVGALVRRHAFTVSQQGLALASMPSRSVLTRTVRVTDSLGHAAPWSASSDQPWLTVTSTGVTPGDLVVTANPAGLAADQTHFATVTVTSGESGVQLSDTIRVGLWAGSQDPVSPLLTSGSFTETITDPIRPLSYSHAQGNTLSVHHVYTGQLVATLNFGQLLGDMAVAPDGSRLFVGDCNCVGSSGITAVDLETRAIAPSWILQSRGGYLSHLEYVRADGMGLIITGRHHVVVAGTGVEIPAAGELFLDEFGWYSNVIVASRDGSLVCSVTRGISSGRFGCYTLQYSDSVGGIAVFRPTGGGETGLGNRDAAMRPDGSRLFAIQPYRVLSYALPSASYAGELATMSTPNNVELLPDGRMLVGAANPTNGMDVQIYDANNAALGGFRLVTNSDWGLIDDQLKVSADGLRIVSLAEYGISSRSMQFTDTP
jgi:hypothetical protein